MVFNFELLAIAVLFVWLLIITALLFQISAHYNSLTKGVSGKTLQNSLDIILKDLKIAQKDIDELKSSYDTMRKESLFYIQKVGLLRFNPFKDTGGDQSFVLALLDGDDTGVIISGIYSRLGTRWYAKKIQSGKGVEYELSEEEKKVVLKASSR